MQFSVRVILMTYSGFILSQLWGWFVAPLGAPELTVLNATGIVLIAFLLRGGPGFADVFAIQQAKEKNRSDITSLQWSGIVMNSILLPTFLLAFGFAVHVLRAYFG